MFPISGRSGSFFPESPSGGETKGAGLRSVSISKNRISMLVASGLASCLFKTPKSAKGKAMTGSIAFRAGGTAFTKRFATTLG